MNKARRPATFLVAGAVWLCGLASTIPAAEFERRTFVYKTVDTVKIEADVWRVWDEKPAPVVVWIHGGGLINGSRQTVPPQLSDLCRDAGTALVSIDYRLAPEVKLPAIIEDLRDAFAWIHQHGPQLFAADASRIIVTGGSAGGYLTMMSGICVQPRPTALVAYWGYGDVDGDWYSKPSEFYRTQTPLVPREQAYALVNRGVLTGTDRSNNRGDFYRYLRQNGLWTKVVTGFDPDTQRQKITPYCPVRNMTPDYPPILMIHGTSDTDVPYDRSAEMAAALEKAGVEHELVTVEGAGHGLRSGDPERVARAHRRAEQFIRRHLR